MGKDFRRDLIRVINDGFLAQGFVEKETCVNEYHQRFVLEPDVDDKNESLSTVDGHKLLLDFVFLGLGEVDNPIIVHFTLKSGSNYCFEIGSRSFRASDFDEHDILDKEALKENVSTKLDEISKEIGLAVYGYKDLFYKIAQSQSLQLASYLPVDDFLNLLQVNTICNSLFDTASTWKMILKRDFGEKEVSNALAEKQTFKSAYKSNELERRRNLMPTIISIRIRTPQQQRQPHYPVYPPWSYQPYVFVGPGGLFYFHQ